MTSHLSGSLASAVQSLGIAAPTPIQREAFSPILRGKNFRGVAATGEGKTFAYLVPLVQRSIDEKYGDMSVLIVVPTEALVKQVCASLVALDPLVDVHMLEDNGRAKFIVATLSSVHRVLKEQPERLSHVRSLVLDEADAYRGKRTLETLAKLMRPGTQVVTFQSSHDLSTGATVTEAISPPSLKHIKCRIPGRSLHDKLVVLRRIVDEEISDHHQNHILIFVRNAREAEILAENFQVPCVHRKSRDVEGTLNNFTAGNFRVLVATDLIARGIHFDHISMVIHFSLSDSLAIYLHRAGRTARAGRAGKSVVLYTEAELDKIKKLEESFDFAAMYSGDNHRSFAKSAADRFQKKLASISSEEKVDAASLIGNDNLEILFTKIFARLCKKEIPTVGEYSQLSGRKNFVTVEIPDVGHSKFPTPAHVGSAVVHTTQDGDVKVAAGTDSWYVDVRRELVDKLLTNASFKCEVANRIIDLQETQYTHKSLRSFIR